MRKASLFIGLVVGLVGCTVDHEPSSGSSEKGEVDIELLQSTDWPVTIDGDVGTVALPFARPVPNSVFNIDDVKAELSDSVIMTVRSDETGVTANLADSAPVDLDPANPGDFSWELNPDRDQATLTFYNETPGGLTLKTDRTYTVNVEITENDYVKTLPASTFTVAPK